MAKLAEIRGKVTQQQQKKKKKKKKKKKRPTYIKEKLNQDDISHQHEEEQIDRRRREGGSGCQNRKIVSWGVSFFSHAAIFFFEKELPPTLKERKEKYEEEANIRSSEPKAWHQARWEGEVQ